MLIGGKWRRFLLARPLHLMTPHGRRLLLLQGNSLTCMLAALNPRADNYDECFNTLQFAVRCQNIALTPQVPGRGGAGRGGAGRGGPRLPGRGQPLFSSFLWRRLKRAGRGK